MRVQPGPNHGHAAFNTGVVYPSDDGGIGVCGGVALTAALCEARRVARRPARFQ